MITSKCENEMLHSYIKKWASDKLAALNQMQTLDCNLQGQHFVRIQAAAPGVKSASFLRGVTQSLSVISSFLVTDVAGQPIGPTFQDQADIDCLTFQGGPDSLKWER